MHNIAVIQILTPDRLVLPGLWFGPEHPKRVLVFIHGLTSNAFSGHEMVVPLVDDETAVITFNNRGNGKIVRMKRVDRRKRRGYSSQIVGEAHEVFTDCVLDIQGVIDFVHERGVHEIILVGHSTGSQKSAYFLSRKGRQKGIQGVVFLSPLSDYAGALRQDKDGLLATLVATANRYVSEGEEHRLLPLDIWPYMHDAQRFLSLYTPESEEELFCYCQKNKIPRAYRSITIPQLVVLGEKDESRDRPIKKIAEWFEENAQSRNKTISIIPGGTHSFFKQEEKVVREIKTFLMNNSL